MLSILVVAIGQFKKTSILPQRLGMEFPGGRGGKVFCKSTKFEEMYEA